MRKLARLVIAGSLAAALAGAEERKSLTVEPFQYSAVMSEVQAIFGTHVDVGRGVAGLLVKRIAQGGRFTVVERNRVDSVIAEQDFGASGRVRAGTQARTGRIRGADCILMGDIVTFGRDDKTRSGAVGVATSGGGGAAGLSRSDFKAVVTLNFRIVDSESGEIVLAGEARGESRRSSKGGFAGLAVGGFGIGGGADFSASNFAETIIGEAVMDAADKLGEQINRQAGAVNSIARQAAVSALVAAVEGNQVYLNAGSSAGVKAGDRFEISEIVREVRDPVSKEVLDVVTKPLGTVLITSVREKVAIGVFSGVEAPKPGARAERK